MYPSTTDGDGVDVDMYARTSVVPVERLFGGEMLSSNARLV